jgi:hypothetical protein
VELAAYPDIHGGLVVGGRRPRQLDLFPDSALFEVTADSPRQWARYRPTRTGQ